MSTMSLLHGIVARFDLNSGVGVIRLRECPNDFRAESGYRLELILSWSEYAKALCPSGSSRTG